MKSRMLGWVYAVAVACAAVVGGCSDDKPAATPGACAPACSAGYTCQASACVALCNPACASGQTCAVVGGSTQCVSGVPVPDGGAVDAPAVNDVTQPPADGDTDVVAPPSDVASDAAMTDAPATDSGPSADVTPPGDAPRPACGMAGQECCSGGVCAGQTVCDSATTRCVAYTPTTGECTTTLRCPAGQACGGIFQCDTRACLTCVTGGARAVGAACATANDCASAYCVNGMCVTPCNVGPTGAADCGTSIPRAVCAQLRSRFPSADGGPPGPTSTIGACLSGCARNGDCGAGFVCRLARNDLEDRLDTVCGAPLGAITPGAMCDPDPPAGAMSSAFCTTSQCIATGAHTGYCSTFCAADADCPAAAPVCIAFSFGRPSGATQMIRMCSTR